MTIITRRSVSNEDDYDENAHTLVGMYVWLFLTAQILGGFVLVLQEAYNRDGKLFPIVLLYCNILCYLQDTSPFGTGCTRQCRQLPFRVLLVWSWVSFSLVYLLARVW